MEKLRPALETSPFFCFQIRKLSYPYGQKEIGSLDENLSLREFRVLGEVLHAELGAAISIELDGKIFIPLHDLQSNLAALVPLDGSNLTRYDYSAFGEEIQDGPILSPWSFSSNRRDKRLLSKLNF